MDQQNLSIDSAWAPLEIAPILCWLSIIGVDLRKKCSSRRKCLVTLYQSVWFLSCIGPHLPFFFYLFSNEEIILWISAEKQKRSMSTIFCLNKITDFIQAAGIFSILLFQSRKWDALWNSLEEMRASMDPESLKKLRKISTIGVLYIIISV